MKIVIQRSREASVSVDNKIVGQIDHGLVILVGFTYHDTKEDIIDLVHKTVNLRIFSDEDGVMNQSLLDTGGSILSISQFTLYADCSKGRRPSYSNALEPRAASILFEEWNQALKQVVTHVETGIFGEDMQVSLINDGPVTITLESREKHVKE